MNELLLEWCDESPPPLLIQGVEQFNAGEYWECHETLETLWRAEPRSIRDLYQGILQVGVAFYHLRRGNYNGTVKLLRRGLPRLRSLPALCHGVHVAEFVRAVEAIRDRIIMVEVERIGELSFENLPRIEWGALDRGFCG